MSFGNLTPRDVQKATAAVRKELRACEDAAMRSKRTDAYAAAERAQEAAFNLKHLFALTDREITALASEVGIEIPQQREPGHGYQESGDL
jgi:hypothetical protein